MKRHNQIFLFFLAALIIERASAQPTRKSATQKVVTDSLTRLDYQQMLRSLSLQLPQLPSTANDPNRPKQTFPKKGSNGYTDAGGRAFVRSQWGTWTNYDEKEANHYTLPDPLVLKNGQPVTDADTWWQQRRPQIIHDYETSIFGRVPAHTPKVTFAVSQVDSTALDGTAIRKTITGEIDHLQYPAAKPVIHMVLYLPVKAAGPVPLMVIVGPGTDGNKQTIRLLNQHGWAAALFDTYALQADNGAGLKQGIIGLMSRGKPRQSEDWGVLRAWSWGLSRALDYFQKDKTINARKIGIQGHSRWGKTALLAAAMDTRWAIVFASCSGSMGASLEKRNFGENLGNIASQGEYHWMAPAFVRYGRDPAAMPVDAHDMIALIAPRPLFITGGTQDLWADPLGEFKACVAATPVYRLLGKTGISGAGLPAPDAPPTPGDLSFREHKGGHTDTLDWPSFMQFAEKKLK